MQPLTWAETRAWATQERIKGNEAYKVKDYKQAIDKYNSALELDESDAEALGNRAAAHMQLKEWTNAENDCSFALRLNPGWDVCVTAEPSVLPDVFSSLSCLCTACSLSLVFIAFTGCHGMRKPQAP